MRIMAMAGIAALLTLAACGGSERDRDRGRDRDRDRSESSERAERGEREERDEADRADGADDEAPATATPAQSNLAGELRSALRSNCLRSARLEPVFAVRFCECVAERGTVGRSEAELQTILGGGAAAEAMGEDVGRQCMGALGGGSAQ